MASRLVSLCAQRPASGWLMRTLWCIRDKDVFGEVWLAKNAGWLDGVGCERGGDDALAALVEADASGIDVGDAKHKAVLIRAKACVGCALCPQDENIDEEAVAILRQCADEDDWFAACLLGSGLLSRTDLQRYDGEGIKYLEKAARLGCVFAMNILAKAFEKGDGVQKDLEKASEWWRRAGECGESYINTSPGFFLQKGCDGFDESMTFQHCATVADSGEPAALKTLGFCYENGIGVARNPEKAFSLYNKAYSLLPDATVVSSLARCFTQGIGTKQDVEKGIELFNKAIEMGDTTAMIEFGKLLCSGDIVGKDEKRGIELLKRATKLGNAYGNLYLSVLDSNYCGPVEAFQQETTVPLFIRLFMTGLSYFDNESVKNPKLGFECIERVIQECEHLLGFDQGANAGDNMLKAAIFDIYLMAQNTLGACYENGIGVKVNQAKALELYRRASKLGSQEAKERLQALGQDPLSG